MSIDRDTAAFFFSLAILVISIAGGGALVRSHRLPVTGPPARSLEPAVQSSHSTGQINISMEMAKGIAQAAYGHAEASKAMLRSQGHVVSYIIKFQDNAEVVVDARSGRVVGIALPSRSDPVQSNLGHAPTVTAREAIMAAEAAVLTAKVIGVRLERKDEAMRYQVNLDNGNKVYVDANSGELVRIQ